MTGRRTLRSFVLGVDGGNSKTDVALVAPDGRLLAAVRGPTVSHQQVALERGMTVLRSLVERARADAGLPPARAGFPPADSVPPVAVLCLAGADLSGDVRRLSAAIRRERFADEAIVLNDAYAALRAGAQRPWGVVLVCGQGVNAAAVAPDGRRARFDALGDISGDWGGGGALGGAALAAAVRGRDGRGPRTMLERAVPQHFGLATPGSVTRSLYWRRISYRRISELAPVVFDTARAGDAVARGIVDRQADELVLMARALIRRLRLQRLDPEVVLAGGVFRSRDALFEARIAEGIRAVAPAARIVPLTTPPVVGAALLALDTLTAARGSERLGVASRTAHRRLGAAFEAWRPDDARAPDLPA